MKDNSKIPPIPKSEKGFWWLCNNSTISGPFLPAALQEQIKQGTLSQESFVYRPGYSQWKKAKDAKELDALWNSI